MNREQRRQRITQIHREQKFRRKQRVRQELESLAVMAEEFVASDKEFIIGYSTNAGRAKKKALVFTALCAIFVFTLSFGINIGIGKMLNVLLFWATFTLMAMYLLDYWMNRERLPFWKQQLQENTEFLQYARFRLQKFDSVCTT